MTRVPKSQPDKDKRTSESPPSADAPSSVWKGVFVLVLVALVSGVVFGVFLSRHEPKAAWAAFFAGLVALWLLPSHLPGLRERERRKKMRKAARRLIKSVRRGAKTQGKWMGVEAKEKLLAQADALEHSLKGNDVQRMEADARTLDELSGKHLTRKGATREVVEQIGAAVLAALLLRAFFYEAFRIPSGSMVPTLLVGDHLFVNKFVYGLRIPFTVEKLWAQVPERGDIVVFNRPGDEHGDDIIKRVVGLPGDEIRVRNRRITICPEGTNCRKLPTKDVGTVHLNESGDADTVTEEGRFTAFEMFEEQAGEHVHWAIARKDGSWGEGPEGVWRVQPGHVFVMGDNRDNSQDSRFGFAVGGFGQVPVNYIKGRADIIWLSIGGPYGVRFNRLFSILY